MYDKVDKISTVIVLTIVAICISGFVAALWMNSEGVIDQTALIGIGYTLSTFMMIAIIIYAVLVYSSRDSTTEEYRLLVEEKENERR